MSEIPWAQFATLLERTSVRMAAGISVVVATVFTIFQIILFRSSPVSAATSCFGLTLATWFGYAVVAALFALPGWLFRGKYRFKVIFLAGLGGGALIAIVTSLMPFLAHPVLRWPAAIVMVALGAIATATGWFSFLMTLVPERLMHRSGIWSTGSGLLAAIGMAISFFAPSAQQKGLNNLFVVSNTNLVRMLSGRAIETETIGASLAGFVKEHDKGGEAIQTTWMPTANEEPQIVAPPMVQAAAPQAPRDPASVCPVGVHTIGSGAALTLSFRNTGTAPVVVYWLDPAGSAKQYRTLAPAESYAQPTYAGHGWAIFDSAHRCLRAFTASAGMSEVPVSAN